MKFDIALYRGIFFYILIDYIKLQNTIVYSQESGIIQAKHYLLRKDIFMAILDDLIMKVEDPVLRERLKKEIHKATKHKKFGLVFEEHLPECTPLYDVPIKKGSRIAPRDTEIKETYTVKSIEGDTVLCISNTDKTEHSFNMNDIFVVAEFGEPIYPYLKPIDTVCNAPDSDLWHTLIEADNYHALQLLEYMYAGKVDCIYIDPPYNKEDSKDWKYNCNYVDGNDMYRHSKWLSMMERRLNLAKKLLNPKDSVLIVTIDELEYLHLGMLLEQLFPEARIQMVSTVINRQGTSRTNEFSRINEYIYFVMLGACEIAPLSKSETYTEGKEIRWITLRRSNASNTRDARPNQFYPIYVDRNTLHIKAIGEVIAPDVDKNTVPEIEGCDAVFPIRDDGTEMLWGVVPEVLKQRLQKGYVKVCGYHAKKPQPYVIQYLTSGTIEELENGTYDILGKNEDGSIIAVYKQSKAMMPKTQWDIAEHDSSYYGTRLIKSILCSNRFTFPKSLYAVKDTLNFFVSNKKNALILDFFAGSGTTMHAVNMLNADDDGHRRCIMVTNNEIGEKAEKQMKAAGYRPGDKEWEDIGIARYATWPRTVCSIEGHDINGKPLKGKYIGSDKPMADGFESNAIYFKLGFLDKNAVALGRQFKELLGVLWMKAGAIGPCPHLAKNAAIPDMMILPENKMAILVNEVVYADFEAELQKHPEIETVYIVTDSDRGYREMARSLNVEHTYQLYRDYLDNFRINHRR